MNAQRKAIIIGEIKYWKESKLLPAQYCDYLLALYTEGEQVPTDSKLSQRRGNGLTILFMLLNLILAPGTALIILNTSISVMYSIFILALLFIICLGTSYLGWRVYGIDSNYLSLALLLNILIISLIVVNQWVSQPLYGLIIIFAQLAVWIGLGIKYSNKLLIIISCLGLIVSVTILVI